MIDEVSTHTMPLAALKQTCAEVTDVHIDVQTHIMLRAALTTKRLYVSTSVTQSRFRMQKAHSNLDDAVHRMISQCLRRAITSPTQRWRLCGTASFCLLKNAPPSLPKKRLSQPPPLPPPQNGYKKAAIVGGRKDTYGHKICQNRCENHREHR